MSARRHDKGCPRSDELVAVFDAAGDVQRCTCAVPPAHPRYGRRARGGTTEAKLHEVDRIEDAAGERLPEAARWALRRVLPVRALEDLRAWVERVRRRGP